MPGPQDEFRERITLQQPTEGANAIGAGGATTWADLATAPSVAAALKPLTGRESVLAGRTDAQVDHLIRIRYRSDLTPKMRALIGSRIFAIAAVLEVVHRRETHLLVQELP